MPIRPFAALLCAVIAAAALTIWGLTSWGGPAALVWLLPVTLIASLAVLWRSK